MGSLYFARTRETLTHGLLQAHGIVDDVQVRSMIVIVGESYSEHHFVEETEFHGVSETNSRAFEVVND